MKKALAMIIGGLFTIPLVTAFDPRFNIIGNWLESLFTPDWLMFRILIAILLFIIYFLAARFIPLFNDEGSKITKGPRVIFSLILAILSTWAFPVDWIRFANVHTPDWLTPLLVFLVAGVLLYLSYGSKSSSSGFGSSLGNTVKGLDDNNPFTQLYRAILYLLLSGSLLNLANQQIFAFDLARDDSMIGLMVFLLGLGLFIVFIVKLISFVALAIGRGGSEFSLPSFRRRRRDGDDSRGGGGGGTPNRDRRPSTVNLFQAGRSSSGIALSWAANPDSESVTRYEIQRNGSGRRWFGSSWTNTGSTTRNHPVGSPFMVSDSGNDSERFRIRAVNSYGPGPWNETSITGERVPYWCPSIDDVSIGNNNNISLSGRVILRND